MAQVKIFSTNENLQNNKMRISDAIHKSLVEVFKLPEDKRFHRFFALNKDDFIFPSDRSANYTIIELSIFEGRSTEAKKQLIRTIYVHLQNDVQISPNDIEITLFETPRENWGIRGHNGDELSLSYDVNIK